MADEVRNNGRNDNGSASIARLTERSVAHQERLGAHDSQIAALETLAVERERRSGFREQLPVLAIFAGTFFGFYQFGLKPAEDKIAAVEATVIYVRDDAERQRSVVFGLTNVEFDKRERFLLELRSTDQARINARLHNLESVTFGKIIDDDP